MFIHVIDGNLKDKLKARRTMKEITDIEEEFGIEETPTKMMEIIGETGEVIGEARGNMEEQEEEDNMCKWEKNKKYYVIGNFVNWKEKQRERQDCVSVLIR